MVSSIRILLLQFNLEQNSVCSRIAYMQPINHEMRFLTKQVQVTKSGNSLVIRIPPELVKFTGLNYKDLVRIYPVEKNRLEIEVAGL